MSEPASTSITFSLLAAFVAWLGPVLGPYALIVFAAGVGALLALTRQPTGTRLGGLAYVGMSSLIALLVTGPIVWAIEHYFQVPANIALIPVAFILGAFRDQVLAVTKQAIEWVPTAFGAILNPAGRGRGGE